VSEAITVLAGGWSASQVNLKQLPGIVIAVNDAAIYAPRIDIIVSMDRLWAEHRFPVVAHMGKPIWLRRSAVKNIAIAGLDHVTVFECDHTSTTLSDEPGTLNGTNSGFCALNLAYQMRPDSLYLVGFDMQRGPRGQAHWFPQYSWVAKPHATSIGRFNDWSEQFDYAAKQLKAANISTYLVCAGGRSAIPAFPQILPLHLSEIQ
jgi:hypothetical protein